LITAPPPLSTAFEKAASAAHFLKLSLGHRQQLFALAGAFGRDSRVATHHQPLCRELGRGDLTQPVLV